MNILRYFDKIFKRKSLLPDSKINENNLFIDIRYNNGLITNTIHSKFTIPVNSKLSKDECEQLLYDILKGYQEKLYEPIWDDNTGEIQINKIAHIPFTKEIYWPAPDYTKGSPKIEHL